MRVAIPLARSIRVIAGTAVAFIDTKQRKCQVGKRSYLPCLRSALSAGEK